MKRICRCRGPLLTGKSDAFTFNHLTVGNFSHDIFPKFMRHFLIECFLEQLRADLKKTLTCLICHGCCVCIEEIYFQLQSSGKIRNMETIGTKRLQKIVFLSTPEFQRPILCKMNTTRTTYPIIRPNEMRIGPRKNAFKTP